MGSYRPSAIATAQIYTTRKAVGRPTKAGFLAFLPNLIGHDEVCFISEERIPIVRINEAVPSHS